MPATRKPAALCCPNQRAPAGPLNFPFVQLSSRRSLGQHQRGGPHRPLPNGDVSHLFQSLGIDKGLSSLPGVRNVDHVAARRETEPTRLSPCRHISQKLEIRERVDENTFAGPAVDPKGFAVRVDADAVRAALSLTPTGEFDS